MGELAGAKPMGEDSFNPTSYKLKALLAGPTGVGKSTVATTIPGNKLVIDLDGRKESIETLPGITSTDRVIQILESNPRSPQAWQRLENLRNELWSVARAARKKNEPFPFALINLQGLSAANRICMYWALLLDSKRGLGGSPAKQHYGPHIKNLSDCILSFLALPCHFIMECHLNLVEDEESGGVFVLPKVYGKQQRTDVPSWFNEVWLCEKVWNDKNKQQKYFIHSSGHGRYDFFKSALNHRGLYWKDPFEIDLTEKPCGIDKLLQLRAKGGVKKQPSEKPDSPSES